MWAGDLQPDYLFSHSRFPIGIRRRDKGVYASPAQTIEPLNLSGVHAGFFARPYAG